MVFSLTFTAAAFQLTRPVWGVTDLHTRHNRLVVISTHTPRVGRDDLPYRLLIQKLSFQLTRPVWGVTRFHIFLPRLLMPSAFFQKISTHTPRVGRDIPETNKVPFSDDFNSHAPCGA